MQDAGWIVFFGLLSLIAAVTTGCSGVEVGGRLGVYRVDERQDSSRTHREAVPWKCYFVNCLPTGEEAQGS